MQSGGYGAGVSEMQQFMVDGGCPSSLFSISTSPPNANSSSTSAAAAAAEIQKFHQLGQHPHYQQAPPHLQLPPPPPPPHFAHFGHPIPITQQLFQQTHHHQFQLFHQQQQQQHHLGLEQDQSGQENSNSAAGPQSFLAAMNFKLGGNESSGGGGGSRDGLNEDDGILQGDDGSESRLHHHHHNPWHREDESAAAAAAGNIKEPFWRPLDIDFINPNNKRPAKDKQPAAGEISSSNAKHFKKSTNESLDPNNQTKTAENAAVTDHKYKLFSELEAICKLGGTPRDGGGGGGGNNTTNQTGSGSALTGDDNPLMPAAAPGPALQPDNVSDTLDGGEAPQPLPVSKSSSGGRKKRSKRKQQKQLSAIATFFETLVKQLMDHQEGLHRKFLEVMERRDQERTNREEAWRKQEAARANREAAARAQERALAASRESAIIAFIEKITGESLVLQTKAQFNAQFTEESQKEHDDGGNAEAPNALEQYNGDSADNSNAAAVQLMSSSSRWPKAEVQALIRVRSGFETRFQEPGLKGPLWEEVSKEMAAMGYSRSAKRCKEKWENINKYFRKTKDSGKKRPQHSKTCPYFHQLDQLYSSTSHSKSMFNSATGTAATPPSSSNANNANEAEQRKDNSELLDAIVVSNEPGKRKAVEISNEEEDDEDSNEEGQGESHGDDDRQRQLLLCDDGNFHSLRS